MSKNTLPVVAAVPNYNMGHSLQELLPRLLEQDYAEVFLLDDASTDDSVDIAYSIQGNVKIVQGFKNGGAGANRNKIIPALNQPSLIHFIDADTSLLTKNAPTVIRELMDNPNIGFIGGLSLDADEWQSAWNYGPRQGMSSDIGAQLQAVISTIRKTNLDRATRLRQRFSTFLSDWPNQFETPQSREVFWSVEQNLVVNSETFQKLGGYDEKLREHEIQDLAIRMDKCGLQRRFEPELAIVHHALQVRQYNRLAAMAKSEHYIASKHGYLNWLRA